MFPNVVGISVDIFSVKFHFFLDKWGKGGGIEGMELRYF